MHRILCILIKFHKLQRMPSRQLFNQLVKLFLQIIFSAEAIAKQGKNSRNLEAFQFCACNEHRFFSIMVIFCVKPLVIHNAVSTCRSTLGWLPEFDRTYLNLQADGIHPRRGRQLPGSGQKHIIWQDFRQKLLEMKEIGARGGVIR